MHLPCCVARIQSINYSKPTSAARKIQQQSITSSEKILYSTKSMTAISTSTILSRNRSELRSLCYELQDYVKMRKYMVGAEVTESSDDVTKWFERQQNPDMGRHYTRILQNIRSSKERIMAYLNEVDIRLETLVKSLNELYDDHVIELSRRAEIRTYLDSVRRTLDTYEVTKTIDLSGYYPTYYLNFYLATWITPPYYLIATPLFKGLLFSEVFKLMI
ncbi:unnamed protein product [Rotaria socialis]